jgi:hypothetical protein
MEEEVLGFKKHVLVLEERERSVEQHDAREQELKEREEIHEKRETEFFERDAGNIHRKWRKRTEELERMAKEQRMTINSLRGTLVSS